MVKHLEADSRDSLMADSHLCNSLRPLQFSPTYHLTDLQVSDGVNIPNAICALGLGHNNRESEIMLITEEVIISDHRCGNFREMQYNLCSPFPFSLLYVGSF